jgi:DNA polymerase-3 subunit delta
MVYLLLDCDEYLVSERLAALKAELGDPELAGLNIVELDGPQTDAGDLLGQASMLAFLAPRRLIIVRGYLTYLDRRMGQSKSAESAAHQETLLLLTGLVEAGAINDLAFVDETPDKRRGLWRGVSLGERHAPGLHDLIESKQVTLETFAAPDARALPGWIQRRAQARNIPIEGRAVQALATYVGANLRQLDNELEKLATYAAGRPITATDVDLLVSDASEAMIWALTDALSQRNGREAMTALQRLRKGDANPFGLLTMIARQYRLMVKVKDAVAQIAPEHALKRGQAGEFDVAKLVGEKPYPVKKAMQQSAGYSFDDLTTILDRLLTADFAMKTGADPDAEIDILMVELTRR